MTFLLSFNGSAACKQRGTAILSARAESAFIQHEWGDVELITGCAFAFLGNSHVAEIARETVKANFHLPQCFISAAIRVYDTGIGIGSLKDRALAIWNAIPVGAPLERTNWHTVETMGQLLHGLRQLTPALNAAQFPLQPGQEATLKVCAHRGKPMARLGA